jgi:hypothetical protein
LRKEASQSLFLEAMERGRVRGSGEVEGSSGEVVVAVVKRR